jgi:hypothetical protein
MAQHRCRLLLAVHRDGRPSALRNRTKRRRSLSLEPYTLPPTALSRGRAASGGDGGLAHGVALVSDSEGECRQPAAADHLPIRSFFFPPLLP